MPFDSFDPPADGGRPAAEAIVTGPGEGERLVQGNRVVFLKGVLPELCFAEWVLDGPFDGPDVHAHDHQVDSFYVLEGELDLTIEDSVLAAGPEMLASVPRGVRHTFNHSRPRDRAGPQRPRAGRGLRRLPAPELGLSCAAVRACSPVCIMRLISFWAPIPSELEIPCSWD